MIAVGIILEAAATLGVPLINHNQRRIRQEYETALTLGNDAMKGQIPVLFLGNSLTLTDLDMTRLSAQLGTRYRVSRLAVEETGYLDWYFALRRLFREGSRPQVVVIGARSYHLSRWTVRGGYFAHNLLHREDILEAAHRTGADATGASDFAFANVSAFYGQRDEINKKLLRLLVPDFQRLAPVLAQAAASRPRVGNDHALFLGRLSELKALCHENGAQLIVWMPPHHDPDREAPEVLAAGRSVGVPVVIPVKLNEIPPDRFPDGEHLDLAGAVQLTNALGPQLCPLLLTRPSRMASARRYIQR